MLKHYTEAYGDDQGKAIKSFEGYGPGETLAPLRLTFEHEQNKQPEKV